MRDTRPKLILGAGLATLIDNAGPEILAKAAAYTAHPKLSKGKPRKPKTKQLIKGAR